MRLLTVIVNYRTPASTLEAADALMRATEGISDAHLVIVDNHSEDGSFEALRRGLAERAGRGPAEREPAERESAERESAQHRAEQRWSDRVELVASGRNGGFGYGNNVALRRNLASSDPADYFYLLNPDAFPESGAVERLLAFCEANPHVGIAGGFVKEPGERPHASAFRFHTFLSEFENGIAFRPISWLLADWIVAMPVPDQTCPVGWVGGASMMIRRSVLEKVGLFDERFFLYFEETDLCRRAAAAGFPTYFVRDSVVTHVGGLSTGLTEQRRQPMPAYWFDSRNYYFDKHHGRLYRYGASLAWVAGRAALQVRYSIQRREDRFPRRILWDFCRHSFLPRSARAEVPASRST